MSALHQPIAFVPFPDRVMVRLLLLIIRAMKPIPKLRVPRSSVPAVVLLESNIVVIQYHTNPIAFERNTRKFHMALLFSIFLAWH